MDTTLSEEQFRAKTRKGTTSCTECRRRKVRCIREPEGAAVCRRCHERGANCVVQTFVSIPSHPSRISSRARITQLETQVVTLSKAIQDIQSKLGYLPTPISELKNGPTTSSTPHDDSDDQSSDSDIVTHNPPSQLHSLFQNDWLSVESTPREEEPQIREAKFSSHLKDVARHALQDLIPPRDAVSYVAQTADRWLHILNLLVPQPYSFTSVIDIIDKFDEMHTPDIDPMSLASWLLTIALAAQQAPIEPNATANFAHHFSKFPKAISGIIEATILVHDSLMCTVPGLSVALHFFRLQMGQGNLHRAWLRLRQFRACAEVVGMPKSFQLVQLNMANDVPSSESQIHRAQIWEEFILLDSLFATLINIPPCINPYVQSALPILDKNGRVQPRVYWRKLAEIATKIQYDNPSPSQRSTNEIYASVLDLDRQLQALYSQTPKSWWTEVSETFKQEDVIRYLHYCIKMRIHLLFAMRQDLEREHTYSRLACTDACESVAQKYLIIRGKLPAGIFLCQIVDLQVFTAAVVLLLTSRFSSASTKADALVSQVIELMEGNQVATLGFNVVQNFVKTFRALRDFLRQDGSSTTPDLILKLPLLGKVHIRRNTSSVATTTARSEETSIVSVPAHNSMRSKRLPQNDIQMPSGLQAMEDFRWDPLTWSIDHQYEDSFQDSMMVDNFDQYPNWEDRQGNLNFNS